MDIILDSITQWLREILVGGIMDNLTGLFDQVNTKVGEIAGQVGQTPQAWNSSVYNMIRTLSDNVIVPIAGIVLAFVMTVEFIQLIIDRNNMHDFETFVFFKWIFDRLRGAHRHHHLEHRYGGLRRSSDNSEQRRRNHRSRHRHSV